MNEHKIELALNEIKDNIGKHISEQKEILNLQEAALFLCISKSTLYKMTHRRSIPFHKPFGKKILFKRSELMATIEGKPIQMNSDFPGKKLEV